jgi:hypothetical protein
MNRFAHGGIRFTSGYSPAAICTPTRRGILFGTTSVRNSRDVIADRQQGLVVKPGEPFPEPELWFHDLLRVDGSPFDAEEIEVFQRLTGVE